MVYVFNSLQFNLLGFFAGTIFEGYITSAHQGLLFVQMSSADHPPNQGSPGSLDDQHDPDYEASYGEECCESEMDVDDDPIVEPEEDG